MEPPVSRIVTRNVQGPPLSPEQVTLLVPIGKTDPVGGLQTTLPQPLPDPDGVAYSTTLPHCDASFTSVMSGGHVTSQVAAAIVTEAVNVLSVSNNSVVSLTT